MTGLTGLDTNVLVRYLTQDDPVLAKANQLIEQTLSQGKSYQPYRYM